MTAATLSERLRAETKDVHTAAERSGIMRELLRRALPRDAYIALLQNLAAVYAAMESEIALHAAHHSLRAIDWTRLTRLPTLQNDIAVLTAVGATSAPRRDDSSALVPATREYVAHLHTLGQQHPERLLAHAYLRYLGDMYGGQILRRLVLSSVADGNEHAVSFYDFTQIDNLHAFIATFRDAIDAMPQHPTEADTMIAEARYGYELHARMFTELATPHTPA